MTIFNKELFYQCGCGKVQIPLHGEPQLEPNCCCRSCVSALKYIEDNKNIEGKGKSAFTEDGTAVAMAGFKLNSFELPSDDELDVGFVKVGEEGNKTRVYTKCCGSLLFHGGGSGWAFAMRMFNRNALYYKEDKRPYVSPEEPCMTIWAAHSFDPSKVPEPKHDSVPEDLQAKFGGMAEPDFDISAYERNPILYPDLTSAEVVPITW